MAYSFVIQPKSYSTFEDEAALIGQCRDWGLLSEKAAKAKAFFYKGHGMNLPCSIVGLVDKMTAVIEFDNKQLHCIHPSFLKEMQTSNYSHRLSAAASEDVSSPDGEEPEMPEEDAPPVKEDLVETPKLEPLPEKKAKKEPAQKLQLPEEKIRMTATVKEFTTVPNNFSDTEDEVVIYEEVYLTDPLTEIGAAWSSHSTTLKKLELDIGDVITFEGKIVKKKLTKRTVPYKINNPSKIQKG